MAVFAHISDLHQNGDPEREARLVAVMDCLRSMASNLDAIIVTGDISELETVEGYERVRALLTADVPVRCCPGNVDRRAPFRQGLLGETGDGPVNQRLDTDEITYLICDVIIEGDTPGRLEDETLAWLREQLADVGPERSVVIAMHQPPSGISPEVVASAGLQNRDDLAAIVKDAPNVRVILVGHFHLPSTSEFAGVPVRMAPAVVAGTRTKWEPEATSFAIPSDPMLSLHVVDDDGKLQTVYRVVAMD